MDNSEFYTQLFGEGTVNEMTQTGDATNDTRSLFPRVNFRDVQDAEMVAESLRESIVTMGKRMANNVKVWATAQEINRQTGGLIEATIMDGTNNAADPEKAVREMVAITDGMLGMFDAVAAQISALYSVPTGTPTQENADYVAKLQEFSTETAAYVSAIEMYCDEMSKKSGEQ